MQAVSGCAELRDLRNTHVARVQPTDKPSYHRIVGVSGDGNSVMVEGDVRTIGVVGANASRFHIFAPPGVDPSSGGLDRDRMTTTTRWLFAGYRYEFPVVGNEVGGTVVGTQPGANTGGRYYAWNRVYDPALGRWTTPDPAQSPVWNLMDYCDNEPVGDADSVGLCTSGGSRESCAQSTCSQDGELSDELTSWYHRARLRVWRQWRRFRRAVVGSPSRPVRDYPPLQPGECMCKIELCCTDKVFPWPLKYIASHSYVKATNRDCSVTLYEDWYVDSFWGGGTLGGRIRDVTGAADPHEGKCSTRASGLSACKYISELDKCIRQFRAGDMRGGTLADTPYTPLGPNSNSIIRYCLNKAGLSTPYSPCGNAWGWGHVMPGEPGWDEWLKGYKAPISTDSTSQR